MEGKLDEVLQNIKGINSKLDSVEKKLDSRLIIVENMCKKLEKTVIKQTKHNQYMSTEISNLKATVNNLQQQSLKNNIIVRGLNEIEKSPDDLYEMIDEIFSRMYSGLGDHDIMETRRIGNKSGNKPRNVLVIMKDTEMKLKIISNARQKNLDGAQFEINGVPFGSKEDKIFLGDHLTSTSNDIFYQARQLKRKGGFKYAWTKFGKVFIKESDSSKAYHIQSIDHLKRIVSSLNVQDLSDDSDDAEVNNEVEVVQENVQGSELNSHNKRNISPQTTNKNPRASKRNKQARN